jgi:uracil-DNA glycosylase family 4
MSLIISVTGQDGVGKTTIVNELIKMYNAKTEHFCQPKDMEDAKQQYYKFLNNVEDNQTYVLDRYYEGEMIYAPLYRNYKMDYLFDLERDVIQKHNHIFIRVTAGIETILERIKIRGEDYVKPEHHVVLKDLFDDFFNNQCMPFIVVNTENDLQTNLNFIKDKVYKFDNLWNNIRNCNCDCLKPIITLPRGNFNAKYMFVGQNPGGRGKDQGVKYALMWDKTNPLREVLCELNIVSECWFNNIALCSTNDNTINKNMVNNCVNYLYYQIEEIKPQKIFALGNEVYKYIGDKYDNVVKIMHPSYVKRFNKMYYYLNSIKKEI